MSSSSTQSRRENLQPCVRTDWFGWATHGRGPWLCESETHSSTSPVHAGPLLHHARTSVGARGTGSRDQLQAWRAPSVPRRTATQLSSSRVTADTPHAGPGSGGGGVVHWWSRARTLPVALELPQPWVRTGTSTSNRGTYRLHSTETKAKPCPTATPDRCPATRRRTEKPIPAGHLLSREPGEKI